jgi:hypothetical protein
MAEVGKLNLSLTGDPASFSEAIRIAVENLRAVREEAVKAGKEFENFNAHVLSGMQKGEGALAGSAQNFQKSLGSIKQSLVDQGVAFSTTQKGVTDMAIGTVFANDNFVLL